MLGGSTGCDHAIEGNDIEQELIDEADDHTADTRVVVQQVRGQPQANGSGVSFDVLTFDNFSGEPEVCNPDVSVSIGVSTEGPQGPFELVEGWQTTIVCDDEVDYDIAMVLDNSGSASGSMKDIRAAALEFAEEVFEDNGRMSLIRVSTHSHVVAEVTDDIQQVSAAIEALETSNGWTALYDAVRLGGETLDAAAGSGVESGPGDTVRSCVTPRRHAIAVYTDGQDNNSADERGCGNCAIPSDGIDTSLEDLAALSVDGVAVPIYVVGVGDEVDEAALTTMAEASNGAYLPVDDHAELLTVLPTIAEYASTAAHVCVDLPDAQCDIVYIQVSVSNIHGVPLGAPTVHAVDLCPGPGGGAPDTLAIP